MVRCKHERGRGGGWGPHVLLCASQTRPAAMDANRMSGDKEEDEEEESVKVLSEARHLEAITAPNTAAHSWRLKERVRARSPSGRRGTTATPGCRRRGSAGLTRRNTEHSRDRHPRLTAAAANTVDNDFPSQK